MKPLHMSLKRTAGALAAVCLAVNGATVLRAADPALSVTHDPTGARITWNATDGMDCVLEASNDFATWTQVNQSVVKDGELHRVFVPADEAMSFYRLVNDGRKQAAYVGSQTCKTCHSGKYNQWIETGHPYKLNKLVDSQPPKYFGDQVENVPNTPEGWTWEDVSYVIGGALWKGRFIDHDGYIVTGSSVQYNLATQGWSGYESAVPVGTKPYDCGSCHTTGWVAVGAGGVHQDGMPGMLGSFTEPGIGCEACHGPGGRHVATLSKSEIVKDNSAALCGSCHIRGASDKIPAGGGFIQHHEQYNEMLSAGHAGRSCNDCHNPHISSRRGLEGAITRDCTDCHDAAEYAQDFHNQLTDCTTCHMPRAGKSAVTENKYTGDVRTHIFKINPAADGQMFTEGGKFANGSTGVTLGYVCYQCHQDADGIGGTGSAKTLEELSAKATGFHHN